MSDLYEYQLHLVTALDPEYDDDGQPLPGGWYFQFRHGTEWVGPFVTSGSAETAAEAELEELLCAN